MRLRNLLLTLLVTLLGMAPAAHAAGTPNISLDKDAPGSVLFGGDSEVTLTARNPSGQPTGHNLTFRDVLPAGTSYMRGSSPIEPRVLRDAPAAGETTLIFENVSDLSGASSYSLTYGVGHSTSFYAVGDSYTNQAGAYVNDNPRHVPKFSDTGTPIGPSATSHTGYATDSATTQISAISIEKSEPSREGELLRGAHDHQTVYTLTVRNNAVAPTEDVVVDDYLPAGLEFLGCATTDNTTDAATNPGEEEEYAGSGPLNPGNAPPAPDCVDPALVETVLTDPDGGGPRPLAVYTHVRWTKAVGTLKPGSSFSLEYVAAIPIRENTTSWPGGMTPTPAGLTQAANLDNNSGAETADEQALVNYARATGDYDGTVAVSDDLSLTRSAEDLAIHKSVDDDTIDQGDVSTWTLDLEASEYRYVDDVRVTDTVPDGLCPLGGVNHEASPQSTECDPTRDVPSSDYTAVTENSDGTWTLRWDQKTVPELARMGPSDTFRITFPTRTRAFYQEAFVDDDPVLTRDSWVNEVSVLGADYVRCAPADPDCTGAGTEIDADETGGIDDGDASSAGQSAGGVKINKQVAEPQAGPVSCAKATYVDGPAPRYGPGDRVCWTVRVGFASRLDSGSPRVTDFLPPGSVYEAGSAEPTPDNDVKATLDDSRPELLAWDLGPVVDSGGMTFEWRFSTLVTKSSATSSGDVAGNLMKFADANSAGTTFPLRDQADFEREEAELSLLKGVRDVNDDPAGGLAANTDNRQVQGGDTVTYRVDITNDGGRDAEDVEVWDDLPAGIECSALTVLNISHGGTCNPLTDRIEWAGLALAAGRQNTLTYDLVIPSDVSPGQTLTNTAGVRTYTSDTNTGGSFRYIPEDNIDPKVTALGTPNAAAANDGSSVFNKPAADLAITKTGDATVAAGGQASYSLTVTNNGPSDATGVRAVDTLPSGTSFVSSSPAGACSAAGDIVTCDIGGLADGASETVDLVVDVPFALGNQTLTNTAVVTGDQADTDSSNDSDSANTRVGPSADLSLVKSVGTATAGGTVTWTLVVSNRGPSSATGVSLDDSLPPGVSFQSATPSQGSCSQASGTVGCTLGTIAPGASSQVTIVAGVPADLPVGTPISNTAGVTADQPDGTPGDNNDSAVTTVQPPPPSGPNLSVDKRASVARPRLGVPFDYVIDVHNAGPGRATDVELTDTLSGAVRLVSVSADGRGRCSRRGQAIRCSLGDLAAGESTRVRLTVRALQPGRLDNTAGVAGDESDVDPSDNRDSERVRVVAPPAAYSVSKRAARGTVLGGELVRFTIVVRMKQGAAAAMRLCDRLPDGLVFVRARGATFRSGHACWRRAYLAPRSALRLKVVARAQRGFSRRQVTNIAVVTGQNLARRSARAPVTITPVFGGAPLGVTG